MKENESALYSHYIIDGVRCDTTPADLLAECMDYEEEPYTGAGQFDDIVDMCGKRRVRGFAFS